MTETDAKTQTFEEKVKSMTAAEIIRAMVRGLKARHVELDMDTFGTWEENKAGEKVCFGCAATNAVCEISGKTFTPDTVRGTLRSRFVNTDFSFLYGFENAINSLRCGRIGLYNEHAGECGFALIENTAGDYLPRLETDYTPDELAKYEALADAQEKNDDKNN